MDSVGNNPLLGVGIYSPSSAARILRYEPRLVAFSARAARAWAIGHGPTRPVFVRQLAALGDAYADVLTFRDMMELFIIASCRACGVSLQSIRIISERLAALLSIESPLSVARVWTDGLTMYADLLRQPPSPPGTAVAVEDLLKHQLAIEGIVKPFMKAKLEFEGDQPARYWPDRPQGRVVLDPLRRFGRPHIAGTGIETAVLYEYVSAGESIADVASWYDIDQGEVRAACRYEARLRTIAAPVPRAA